jgi:hypothetical protein
LIKKIEERNFYYPVYKILFKDKKGKSLGLSSRLFVKSSIKKVTGIIHTGIEFKENQKEFPQDAYIIHHYEKPTRGGVNKNYMEIENYERPIKVYLNYLKRKRGLFVGSFFSFMYNLPKPMNVYLTAFGIGYSRYLFDVIHRDLPFYNIKNVINQVKYLIEIMKFFDSLPKEEQELRIKISKEIQECGGVIRYLGLDKNYIVENLTKTFKWDMSGIEAFRKLLLYRHFHKKPAYRFPY